MAKSVAVPDPLARRHDLERALDPARARAIGEAFLAEQREVEAVAFLKKADAREALEALCGSAIARGDAFLLRETCAALGREPERGEWEQLERAAASQGRERYAAEARRQVERLSSRSR
jgi:hypothetical protein